MNPLVLLIVVFVAFVSISAIYRSYKRRKKEDFDFEPKLKYKRRLNANEARRNPPKNNSFVTKYNSQVDYREPLKTGKDDYADWGS
ncbi:MAG: hypothetical protein FWG91_09290 [Lachnospiraceae bacterium]|nr:hypothetical protein [Lachnospiraceae bacterium]